MRSQRVGHEWATFIFAFNSKWLPKWHSGKEPTCYLGGTRDAGSISRLGRSPRVGNDNPLQYCCLENSMDRKPGCYSSWSLKNRTRLSTNIRTSDDITHPSALSSSSSFPRWWEAAWSQVHLKLHLWEWRDVRFLYLDFTSIWCPLTFIRWISWHLPRS